MKLKNYEVHLPSYSIGNAIYDKIGPVCESYGRTVLIIGGKKAGFFFIDGFVQEDMIEKLMQFFYSLKPEDLSEADTDVSSLLKFNNHVETIQRILTMRYNPIRKEVRSTCAEHLKNGRKNAFRKA